MVKAHLDVTAMVKHAQSIAGKLELLADMADAAMEEMQAALTKAKGGHVNLLLPYSGNSVYFPLSTNHTQGIQNESANRSGHQQPQHPYPGTA